MKHDTLHHTFTLLGHPLFCVAQLIGLSEAQIGHPDITLVAGTGAGVPTCPPVALSKFEIAFLFNDNLLRFFFFILVGY